MSAEVDKNVRVDFIVAKVGETNMRTCLAGITPLYEKFKLLVAKDPGSHQTVAAMADLMGMTISMAAAVLDEDDAAAPLLRKLRILMEGSTSGLVVMHEN